MEIGVAQFRPVIGDIRANIELVLGAGAELIVFRNFDYGL